MADEESMTAQERGALFREWEEDYRAARVRDLGEAGAAAPGQPVTGEALTQHPWPSEIARENQRKPVAQPVKDSEKDAAKDAGYSM